MTPTTVDRVRITPSSELVHVPMGRFWGARFEAEPEACAMDTGVGTLVLCCDGGAFTVELTRADVSKLIRQMAETL